MHECYFCSECTDIVNWDDVVFIRGQCYQIHYTLNWNPNDKEGLHQYVLERVANDYGVNVNEITLYSDNRSMYKYSSIPASVGMNCCSCGIEL